MLLALTESPKANGRDIAHRRTVGEHGFSKSRKEKTCSFEVMNMPGLVSKGYDWYFVIRAHADTLQKDHPIDLAHKLAEFFNNVAPWSDRVIGDASPRCIESRSRFRQKKMLIHWLDEKQRMIAQHVNSNSVSLTKTKKRQTGSTTANPSTSTQKRTRPPTRMKQRHRSQSTSKSSKRHTEQRQRSG